MRANSSTPGLVVVMLAALGGCKPAEEPVLLVVPPEPVQHLEPPTTPAPAPAGAELQELLRDVRVQTARAGAASQAQIDEVHGPQPGAPTQAAVPPGSPPVQKLYFQCGDDVTFAVRANGGVLEVYPPGVPDDDYVVFYPRPSEPGTRYYTAGRAEFRFDGELATLILNRERWADCVSNPAAAVWQAPPRRDGR